MTVIEAVRIVGKIICREISFDDLSEEQAREQIRVLGLLEEVIEYVIAGEPAEQVTGQKPHAFSQWVIEHTEAFL